MFSSPSPSPSAAALRARVGSELASGDKSAPAKNATHAPDGDAATEEPRAAGGRTQRPRDPVTRQAQREPMPARIQDGPRDERPLRASASARNARRSGRNPRPFETDESQAAPGPGRRPRADGQRRAPAQRQPTHRRERTRAHGAPGRAPRQRGTPQSRRPGPGAKKKNGTPGGAVGSARSPRSPGGGGGSAVRLRSAVPETPPVALRPNSENLGRT